MLVMVVYSCKSFRVANTNNGITENDFGSWRLAYRQAGTSRGEGKNRFFPIIPQNNTSNPFPVHD